MNKKNTGKIVFIFLLIGLVSSVFFYVFFIRSWVVKMSLGEAPKSFVALVEWLYPRYVIEKNRFAASFFLAKADQVVLRWLGVLVLGGAFGYGYTYAEAFRKRVQGFWDKQQSLTSLHRLRKLYAGVTLYLVFGWIFTLIKLQGLGGFYEPVLLLKPFGASLPPFFVFMGLYSLLLGALIGLFFNYLPVYTGAVVAVLFVFLQAYFYSFHKLDHTYASYMFGVVLMPFLSREMLQGHMRGVHTVSIWPLQLIRVCIAFAYFFSGLEKILISGIAWVEPQTLQTYFQQHASILYPLSMQFPVIPMVLSIAVLVFELGFPSILFFSKIQDFYSSLWDNLSSEYLFLPGRRRSIIPLGTFLFVFPGLEGSFK